MTRMTKELYNVQLIKNKIVKNVVSIPIIGKIQTNPTVKIKIINGVIKLKHIKLIKKEMFEMDFVNLLLIYATFRS